MGTVPGCIHEAADIAPVAQRHAEGGVQAIVILTTKGAGVMLKAESQPRTAQPAVPASAQVIAVYSGKCGRAAPRQGEATRHLCCPADAASPLVASAVLPVGIVLRTWQRITQFTIARRLPASVGADTKAIGQAVTDQSRYRRPGSRVPCILSQGALEVKPGRGKQLAVQAKCSGSPGRRPDKPCVQARIRRQLPAGGKRADQWIDPIMLFKASCPKEKPGDTTGACVGSVEAGTVNCRVCPLLPVTVTSRSEWVLSRKIPVGETGLTKRGYYRPVRRTDGLQRLTACQPLPPPARPLPVR